MSNYAMQFTSDISKLKELGYEFQKLYANNYKSYRKKVEGYTIWLWVLGKEINVNDWYDSTGIIIDFVKANKLQNKEEHTYLELNSDTKEVRIRDNKIYWEALKQRDNPYFRDWHEILIRPVAFKALLVEIEKITTQCKK